jgi:hypothetical protein
LSSPLDVRNPTRSLRIARIRKTLFLFGDVREPGTDARIQITRFRLPTREGKLFQDRFLQLSPTWKGHLAYEYDLLSVWLRLYTMSVGIANSFNALFLVELHCHSCYSLREGASTPEELVLRARELGYDILALTDRDGLYDTMAFAQAAKASAPWSSAPLD